MRWKCGDIKPIEIKVLSDTLIETGDMLWMDKDNAKPACLFPTGVFVDPETAVRSFVANFVGIAMESSQKGEVKPVKIATGGVFEVNRCGEFKKGDLVGPDMKAIVAALKAHLPVRIPNQQVIKVSHREFCIGKVTETTPDSMLICIDTSHRAHRPKHIEVG